MYREFKVVLIRRSAAFFVHRDTDSFPRSQTVPNEFCVDSLYAAKRRKMPILPVVFSATVQNILRIDYFVPFQCLFLAFPRSYMLFNFAINIGIPIMVIILAILKHVDKMESSALTFSLPRNIN